MFSPLKKRGWDRKNFDHQAKIGLTLITFAMKEEDVAKRVRITTETVEQALSLVRQYSQGEQPRPVFDCIDIVIPSDPDCAEHDCGKTAEALKSALRHHKNVYITEYAGDPFVTCRNASLVTQIDRGCRYNVQLSPEGRSYLNQATIDLMLDALCDGALCVPACISEMYYNILCGRPCNTFCAWQIGPLLAVGGFDAGAVRNSERGSRFLMRFDPNGDISQQVRLDGVEEVVPGGKIYLANERQPFIAPIVPVQHDGALARYEEPDPVKEPELSLRQKEKMALKILRQNAHLLRAGLFIDLRSLVMPAYKQEVPEEIVKQIHAGLS